MRKAGRLGVASSVYVNVARLVSVDGRMKRPGVDRGVRDVSPTSTFRLFGEDGVKAVLLDVFTGSGM